MKGYKAFNQDWKCNGFQYEIGKEYQEKDISLCSKGFHFCTNPLDVLNYYDLCECKFAEVEALGKTLTHPDDSKVCTDKIKIEREMTLADFVNKSIEYLLEVCTEKNDKVIASSGDFAQLASSGDFAQLASSGYSAQLASSGYSAQLASSGDSAKLASSGEHSVIAGIGYNNTAKGIKGNWIVLAEWVKENEKWIPKYVKSVKVDGKRIKENVYYRLVNGKFVKEDSK